MSDEPEAEATDPAGGDGDSSTATAEEGTAEVSATDSATPDDTTAETDEAAEAEAETEEADAAAAEAETEAADDDDGAATVPPEPAAPATAPVDAPLTGLGRRFGAFVLDLLLSIVLLGIGWLIWSLVIWTKGQSPGKALLGIRVLKADTGRSASWGTMVLRELVGKWLLGSVTGGITTIVSIVMILTGDTRQGLWDKIAGTTVVDDPEGQYLG